MPRFRRSACLGLPALLALSGSLACSAGGTSADGRSGAGAAPAGGAGNGQPGNGLGGGKLSLGGGVTVDPDAGKPRFCGDGKLTSDEACDDGNQADGDGCTASCLGVEPGFSCIPAGEPCRRVARCGDGLLTLPEPCDDGNSREGDGCGPTCKIEIGFKCSGSPSVCEPAVCGDGKVEGAEACDDGNSLPFDGCSSRCQAEPDCSQGACRSRCGDGVILGEACDDGNTVSGDGCAADCTVEAGFVCAEDSGCEKVNGKCVVRADAIFRDFTGEVPGAHPDFLECTVLPVKTGLVQAKLNADGKPVLAVASSTESCIESPKTFAQWYRRDQSNVEVAGIITLFENGMGGFVNRYGANGEQWTDGRGRMSDGTPLFFPLDGKGKMEAGAEACFAGHDPAGYVSMLHNFHFTTEVTHWFKYEASKTATLEFTGDDDVWVFLNGTLAVDLGGIHQPAAGSVSIGPATAAQFGLVDGSVYPIKVFQAERKICGSNFRLTLSGFIAGRSDCSPTCGDALVSLGEECDDGVNDGGQGECSPGCKRGAFCGDGIVQEGEDCDDGNALDGDTCGSACRRLKPR